MKKQFLLGILPVFAVSLLSFDSTAEEVTITEALSPCGDYCSGYADAKEEERVMTMEEWTAIYNECTSRRCPD